MKRLWYLIIILPLLTVSLGMGIYAQVLMSARNLHFDEGKYVDLLSRLRDLGYQFVLPRDFRGDLSGKVAVLVHDVDDLWFGATVLSSVERSFGIRSAFFLRPDGSYFSNRLSDFQSLEKEGWEIGFHYDSLSRSNGNQSAAIKLFQSQVSIMRQYFTVVSTRSHGDWHNPTVNNLWLYGNHTDVWQDLGLREFSIGALTGKWTSIDDTHFVWTEPEQKEDLILVNMHSDYW